MKAAVVVFPASNCDRDAATALEQMTGWQATRGVEDAIDDVAAFERARIAVDSLPTSNGEVVEFGDGPAVDPLVDA